MNMLRIFTFCLTLILSSFALAQGESVALLKEKNKASRFSADWRLKMNGEDTHDEQNQRKIFSLKTDLRIKYALLPSLYLDIQPSLTLQSGTTQSVEEADKAESKISLQQAALIYRPLHVTRFSVGALNQEYAHTHLLLDDLAFPGARAELMLTSSPLKTSLLAETAIPTSSSLSTNTQELEATPSLNTVALRLYFQENTDLKIKFTAGYYSYSNLPSAVAEHSRLLGNKVQALSEKNYTFVYQYQGLESLLDVSIPIFSWLNILARGEYLINQQAPESQNKAYSYFAGSELVLSKNLIWSITGGYFSLAPESAVSYFNARQYETNRNGYGIKSFLDFKQSQFKLGVEFQESDVMYINSIQSKEQKVFLKLETAYADL